MILKAELDLESADPVHGFCTLSHGEERFGEVYCES